MPIIVNLDVMMAKRKMSLNELSAKVDITLANLSILKNNHAKAVRFTTLEAICGPAGVCAGGIVEFWNLGDASALQVCYNDAYRNFNREELG